MQDYGTQGRLDTNDSLRLASLWHSMHAISKELSPVGGCTGIELLEADTFDLHCFQALTGMASRVPIRILLKRIGHNHNHFGIANHGKFLLFRRFDDIR